jgi:hypothetical protein
LVLEEEPGIGDFIKRSLGIEPSVD